MGNDIINKNITNILEYKIGEYIWTIASPILIIFGTVGNILTVIVLTRPHIRSTSSAIYLIVLAFTDITVLNTGLMRYWIMKVFDWDIRHYSSLGCKIHLFMSYFSPDFSAWILVAVTIERLMLVWYPYRIPSQCSRTISIIVLSLMACMITVINCHMLYGVGDFYSSTENKTKLQRCGFMSVNYDNFFAKTWPFIDETVYSFGPFCFLLIGNILILRKVLMAKKKSRRITPSESLSTLGDRSFISSMSRMLLLLNTVFLISTFPISIYLIGYQRWLEVASPEQEAILELFWAIVNILMYTNHALNFVLYCITGSRFRHEAMTLFCCKK